MRRVVFCLLTVWAVCFPAVAQDFTSGISDMAGMEAAGLRIPEYDEQGNLRAQLYGGFFKVLDSGEVEITNLKIELYRKGEVAMTIFAPHCFFNRETKAARSDGRVLVESDVMTVVGLGFVWSAESGRFEILHDSKVLVGSDAKRGLRERGL